MNTSPSAPARIEIVDLVKTYQREGGANLTPVNRINLTVAPDELVVLLGPSGCGKTTLLRCVAGLERPDAGEIIINGRTVFSSRKGIYVPANRREMSFVFQTYALWPHMTVGENVAYPLLSRNVPKQQIADKVSAVLDMVGVGGLGKQYPNQISGGQQQRVALARALVSDSSVVLFDEPLSNVDAQVRAQLRYELQAMQRRLGFSGLYVTHDQSEAMELGHRVAVLDAGVMSALGTPEEIYDTPPNEYVARFVGTANVWSGTVSQAEEHTIGVAVNGQVLSIDRSVSGRPGTRLNDPVSVVARPEHLTLRPGPPADGESNALGGTLEARLFSGAYTEYVVRLGADRKAVVWAQDSSRLGGLSIGDPVHLTAPATRLRLIDAAGADR
ncbi:ABC transporter ATP-binding protein [Aureimonas altamirensis]|uniref:ABC transporter ATP-binding protein n=1 Tax=Aureimonas altamirensis TaxID=370622 RepID=UPI00255268E0|nr:ABC transporter ATP-binding protein [Aureimonas altamirensis]